MLEVEHAKKKDDLSDRVIKFNKSLHKLRKQIQAKISERNVLIEKLKTTKAAITERNIDGHAFLERQETFIDHCKEKLEKYRKTFLEDSQSKLYEQIKNIILSQAWPDERNFMGGKYILDEHDNKIAVPSGIEKMTRVIANFPLPEAAGCYGCFNCLFWKPALVSRRTATLDLQLSASEKIDAIKELIKIAADQLSKDKRRGILTRQFYGGLNQIKVNQLDDQQYLEIQINLIGNLNGQFGLLDFAPPNAPAMNLLKDDWTEHKKSPSQTR